MVDNDPLWINASGGAPAYDSREMRRAMAALLSQAGSLDRFGARSGVHPGGGDAVTLSGTTWTVRDTKGSLYADTDPLRGPYLIQFVEESGAVNAADGTNARKDIIVARVYDDDEDASGFRRARPEYIAGTPDPSPLEPTVPAGAFRMATIDVPAGGSPGPTLTYNAPFIVAQGGVLPVRNSSELPTIGLHDGMYADQKDTKELKRAVGSTWETVATPGGWEAISSGDIPNSASEVSIDITKGGLLPAGTFDRLRVYAIGDFNATGTMGVRVNDDATTDQYRRNKFTRTAAGTVVSSSSNTLGTAWLTVQWTTASSCTFELELLRTDASYLVGYLAKGGNQSEITDSWGRLESARLVSSIQLFPTDGATLFGDASGRWWAEGYRR